MRLYLDASAIIYSVEGVPALREAVLDRIAGAGGAPTPAVLTSRLSRLECRVKPLRDADSGLLARFDQFFARKDLLVAEVAAAIIERATELRARYCFRTPDAIHLATAIEEKADLVLTGDATLRRCTEVQVEVLTV